MQVLLAGVLIERGRLWKDNDGLLLKVQGELFRREGKRSVLADRTVPVNQRLYRRRECWKQGFALVNPTVHI